MYVHRVAWQLSTLSLEVKRFWGVDCSSIHLPVSRGKLSYFDDEREGIQRFLDSAWRFFSRSFYSLFLSAGASDWEEAQVLGREDVRGLLVHSLLQPKGDSGQAGHVESQVHRVVSPSSQSVNPPETKGRDCI